MTLSWEIEAQCGSARVGRLKTTHGEIETPVFMPVGTYGAVKTMSPDELTDVGSQIILGNTYHLYLRPGLEIMDHFRGLHSFMGWDKPILTDSGGFQVFSLAKLGKITDEGVEFRSHLNGDKIHLTPELSAKIQQSIGSDIAMVLDQCPPLPSPDSKIREAVERSYQWAKQFLTVPRRSDQQIFGIFQGGTNLNLRLESLEKTMSLPIDGLAIGGLSVGEPHEAMVEVLQGVSEHLPPDLPHYLMGVGTPLDLLEAVHAGIDMFDCVMPTRNARNASIFTDSGPLNLKNAKYKMSDEPIDSGCKCLCCQKFSRGYLRHLFHTGEVLGCRLATIHNLHYYHGLMQRMRASIRQGSFANFYDTWRDRFRSAYLKPKHSA